MDRDAVSEYVKQSEAILDSSPQMDEANTKAATLQRQDGVSFLGLLGWRIPKNTQLEYSVEAFGQTYRVDYALILDSTPVAFLEAKGADTTLTNKHEKQLSSYMTNKNVNYGILTNGKQYRFFQRRVDGSNIDIQRIGNIPLEELPNRLALLEAYEKESIESGESSKIIGRINELREARRTLEAEKDDLAVEISDLLADHVSDAISSIGETQAKEMIDRVIQEVESEIDSDAHHSGISGEESPKPPSNQKKSAKSSEQQPENDPDNSSTFEGVQGESDMAGTLDKSGRWVVTFLNNGTEIAAFSSHKQSDTMIDATNYLITQHDLISKIEPLPWIPGRTKAIINDVPTWEQADPNYKPLVDGFYLDIKLSKGGKKREIRRMAETCGLDVVFEGDW